MTGRGYLYAAMREMEPEESPVYTLSDLKVLFIIEPVGAIGQIARERLQRIKSRLAAWILEA